MIFKIEALQLARYPALSEFLQAVSPEDISTTFDTLQRSQPFPNFPYSLRLHVTRATISVYEVCAALGKLEHLSVLLSKREAPLREYRIDSRVLKDSIVIQNAAFFLDLMCEAVVNSRLEIIDFLAPYYRDSQALVISHFSNEGKLNSYYPTQAGDVDEDHVLLRLAIGTGSLAIFNRLLALAGDRLKLHGLNNKLLCLAMEYGHLELVNRFLEFKTVLDTVPVDADRILISAIRGGSLPVFNRFLELMDITSVVRGFGIQLLSVAITSSAGTSPLEIVDRILSFKEIRKLMNEKTNDLLGHALRGGRLDIIERLLAYKGVQKELKTHEHSLLSMTIKSRRSDIFNSIYSKSNYIAAACRDPQNDLLCLAALMNNEVAMDALLANTSARMLARKNNFYRAYVGERLFLRAKAMGVIPKVKIPQLPDSPDTEESLSSGARTSAVSLAGQKRVRFFESEYTGIRLDDALAPKPKTMEEKLRHRL